MRELARLLTLSGADQRLLLRAYALLWFFRLGLWVVPIVRLRKLVHTKPATGWSHPPERLAWSVRTAARCVPKATCLTQAMALQRLLAQAGGTSQLEIGVAKEGAQFEAHAWVTSAGRVLIGGGDVRRYTTIAVWEGGGQQVGPND